MVMPRITDDEYPAPAAASPELSVPPRRRKFTAKEKLRILGEIDRAAGIPGAIGAIMRREGLYFGDHRLATAAGCWSL